MRARYRIIAAAIAGLIHSGPAAAAELKVLSAGAYRAVVDELKFEFKKRTSHNLVTENATVGVQRKRVADGEAFDVVIATPDALSTFAKSGKLTGNTVPLARIGIGVMVKAGAPLPDVSTVEAFKKTLLAAKSVAYLDPSSGGSSGIYLHALFQRLGIADAIAAKAKLQRGGRVAELVSRGEAEIGIHQMSQIVADGLVTLVGPLPAEIQNYTTYAAAIASGARNKPAAKTLIDMLAGPATAPVLKARGMERPTP
jgi:molybdate transport system substrate-binding protein